MDSGRRGARGARVAIASAAVALVASGCNLWTMRVSTTSSGADAKSASAGWVAISRNGRYVAFTTAANILGDGNATVQAYVKDTSTKAVERVSTSTGGAVANGAVYDVSISDDGTKVAFVSEATNLVGGDSNAAPDVFVKDRSTGTTTRVSTASDGSQSNAGLSTAPEISISGDGRYVAFVSAATNLVAGDTNGLDDLFVKDRQTNATTLVNARPLTYSMWGAPSLSTDGRYVSFWAGSSTEPNQVYVHDRTTGTTTTVSRSTSGAVPNSASEAAGPRQLSDDGRYVAFASQASNLVAGDSNGTWDVFVGDRTTGRVVERVSVTSAGAEAHGASGHGGSSFQGSTVSISGDGRYVAFTSIAADLVSGDTNGLFDVFVHDRVTHRTVRLGSQSGSELDHGSADVAISGDGRYVGFVSAATNFGGTAADIGEQVYLESNPTPTLTSVAPSTFARGTTTPITITGSSLVADPLPKVWTSGSGITVVVQSATGTTIQATVTVAPSAATGTRDLSVRNTGTGPGVDAGSFNSLYSALTIT